MKQTIPIILSILFLLMATPESLIAQQERPLYLDPNASVEDRVEDLLARMTLEEKIGQMSQLDISQINTTGLQADVFLDPEKARDMVVNNHVGSFLNGEAVPPQQWYEFMAELTRIAVEETRLGIPIIYGIDHVHGASYMAETTIFPQPINLGATFNTEHGYNMGWVTALEMADVGHHWNFAPTLDVGRNQIWGRLYETFGEDPLLTSRMGVAYLDGFHNNEEIAPYRLASNAKHFLAYSDPVSGWDKSPASLSMQEIYEMHLPPFRAAIEAGVMTIMANSSEVNGEPVHASALFLTEMLRKQLGFDGVVLTDWDEVGKLAGFHRMVPDYKEGTYRAVTAGIDVSMTPLSLNFNEALLELVQEGRISEERVDESVRRVLRLKFEIGLFENPFPRNDRLDRIGSEESRMKSLQAARESLVLLKNEDDVLPLQNPGRIVVAGPSANSKRNLSGGWTLAWQGGREEQYPDRMLTVYTGLQQAFPEAQIDLLETLPESREALMDFLAGAETIIYAGGEEPYAEFLGNILDLNLEASQKEDIRRLSESGIPLVTVLIQGRPRLITDVLDHMDALVHAGLPGFEGGEAIADVLSGNVNPSGRLPFTYPAFSGHMLNYNHKPSDIFFHHPDSQNPFEDPRPGTHLFEFGDGLSYTEFELSDLRLSAETLSGNDHLTASVTVTNTGDVAGSKPVLWFLSQTTGLVPRPVRELKHFERVTLEPGASQTLTFEIHPEESLWYPDASGNRVFEATKYFVRAGTLTQTFTYEP
ncbi:beta-glucosidase [Cyclonatronum proteinivorum]|uniref:beta-glucosidase n=1 Tax=Cyclonatronum proteinivorum TaxID=1457365 RepID=A0A345UJT3_9BACT|nr:glycoside hydrolase family 3 N-terminal domain-containing protein [Cyclonatronum proteinivorum]AXJ00735.1 beta-glucosidase [Cyclonatronum proteinivorum]